MNSPLAPAPPPGLEDCDVADIVGRLHHLKMLGGWAGGGEGKGGSRGGRGGGEDAGAAPGSTGLRVRGLGRQLERPHRHPATATTHPAAATTSPASLPHAPPCPSHRAPHPSGLGGIPRLTDASLRALAASPCVAAGRLVTLYAADLPNITLAGRHCSAGRGPRLACCALAFAFEQYRPFPCVRFSHSR